MHRCTIKYQETIVLFSYDVGYKWKIEGRTAFLINDLGKGIKGIFASVL